MFRLLPIAISREYEICKGHKELKRHFVVSKLSKHICLNEWDLTRILCNLKYSYMFVDIIH